MAVTAEPLDDEEDVPLAVLTADRGSTHSRGVRGHLGGHQDRVLTA
jgi:hypothetical protein